METLGEGGFGTVYRAEPLVPAGGLQHQVVLKIISGEALAEETVSKLRDEAQVLKHLNHPAVIGVEDMVPLDRGWAVVSEYISGVYLSELIAEGPLPIAIALELIEDIADALRAAYNAPSSSGGRLSLTHRDLRPANIRITPEGSIKVLDFGGARVEFALPDGRPSVEKSRPYEAPERSRGDEGPQGDIFSLGVIMAECLLGEFMGLRDEGRHEQWLSHLKNRLGRRLGRDNKDLAPALAEVVVDINLSMLAEDPEERPDAQEVADACRLIRKEIGGEWIRLWAQKNIARMMAEQDTLIDDGAAGSIVSEITPTAGGTAQQDPEVRSFSGWVIAAVVLLVALAAAGALAIRV